MMELSQGQRIPVSSLSTAKHLTIQFDIQANGLVVDLACFGLDAHGKLSDDRYMVFFNQPKAPADCVCLTGPTSFSITLAAVPATIDRLVFSAAIDTVGNLSQLGKNRITLLDGTHELARCNFAGDSFNQERAVMLLEFYRRNDEWRLVPVLQGFNDGLAKLVEHFGGEVADSPAPSAPPAQPVQKISLEKKIQAAAPALLSLAKKAQISLEKANLSHISARVGLVLDVSGSMNRQYKSGRVQDVVNRLLPLAVHFDDDGEIDCWGFGKLTQQLPTINLFNFQDYIQTANGGWNKWPLGPRINCEYMAIDAVVDFYSKSNEHTPIYILFISDGGVSDNRKIIDSITRAAHLPIFWQFVGIGGYSYGILEKLDSMTGRVVDNCNFFALDDLHDVSEEELYDRLMAEFPAWLRAAKAAGVLMS